MTTRLTTEWQRSVLSVTYILRTTNHISHFTIKLVLLNNQALHLYAVGHYIGFYSTFLTLHFITILKFNALFTKRTKSWQSHGRAGSASFFRPQSRYQQIWRPGPEHHRHIKLDQFQVIQPEDGAKRLACQKAFTSLSIIVPKISYRVD